MIKCVVFDFDGTLYDSNEIKQRAFFDSSSEYAEAHDFLRQLLANPDAGDRYAIFREFAAHLVSLGLSDEAAPELGLKLAKNYSDICFKRISRCKEISGSEATLRSLKQSSLKLYINSATPDEALKALVDSRNISPLFDGILGSSHSKTTNLIFILHKENIMNDQMIMVGDNNADYQSAINVGCHFIGIGESKNAFTTTPHILLPDLTNLSLVIGTISPKR
ncbi:HAD family hydrolase [Magnetovibrio blakemorei]|uniref:phosphoglycolate phosphatase n=1 Tax=Magnetovibrio blakemorei TaxID=28181 RepID=A0A1E5Q684_9PROT|nr:HAD-IA family hydrolase [Magnetovibrio blakemorei]OEJ66117.1 hypothetical protein BEN30_12990 [Magnetovibrio blakemorei]